MLPRSSPATLFCNDTKALTKALRQVDVATHIVLALAAHLREHRGNALVHVVLIKVRVVLPLIIIAVHHIPAKTREGKV